MSNENDETKGKTEGKVVKISVLDERRCSIDCKFLRIDIEGTSCLLYGHLSHNGESIFRRGDCVYRKGMMT